jgi:hypothetical protein
LAHAIQIDDWGGQLEEATTAYNTLRRKIQAACADVKMSHAERKTIHLICEALAQRVVGLNDMDGEEGISLNEVRQITPVLENVFTSRSVSFPIDMSRFDQGAEESDEGEVHITERDGKVIETKVATRTARTPQKANKVQSGHHSISFKITHIGLKDAQTYIHPSIEVSVVAHSGRAPEVLETVSTPNSNRNGPQFVQFNHEVVLETTWEEMKRNDLSVFFEFKHYKPKKRKVSTRCYAFADSTEIAAMTHNTPVALELYKKPTDFTKRRTQLFTVKDLFLNFVPMLHVN